MLFSLGISLLLYWIVTLGLAWPVARRLPFLPAEKACASAAFSVIFIFFAGWAVYVFSLSLKLLWSLPALAIIGLICERRSVADLIRDSGVRTLLTAQALLSAWSVGLLALVLSYSGGGWLADWWGHLQRTSFFLDRGPHDILFSGFDPLTSRPPLANVVNGVLLQISHRDFVHYQFFSTLLGSMVFLPAGLLAQRFGGNKAVSLLAVLLMANPMFIQNVTYPWTKLPAAFFTLTALYFFLRAHDIPTISIHRIVFAVVLAAGLLTHYSTGPYAVILGSAWIVQGWSRRNDPVWRRDTFLAALAGALVLATWFGWTFSVYGIRGSLLTNTSITDQAPETLAQLRVVGLNIRDTLVPHFLRTVDSSLLAQQSVLGKVRDWFFQLYQTNFFFAFGSVAWLAILFRLNKQSRGATTASRNFWIVFIVGNTLLGIAVHGARDQWGLAHICLQPLIILGLVFLASQWRNFGSSARAVLIAFGIIDFIAGIGLQFVAESFALERWCYPDRSVFSIMADYSQSAAMNFYAKMQNHWAFLGDFLGDYGYAITAFLAAVFLSALRLVNSSNMAEP